MRKILLILFCITAIFSFNKVNAAEIKLEYDTNINEITSSINNIGSAKVEKQINELINIYNSDYSANYPYFYIQLYRNGVNKQLRIVLTASKQLSNIWTDLMSFSNSSFTHYVPTDGAYIEFTYEYSSETGSFIDVSAPGMTMAPVFKINSEIQQYNPYRYYYSNFDLYYKGSVYKEIYSSYGELYLKLDDDLLIPTFEDSSVYSVHKADSDFLIEPYYLFDEIDLSLPENYETIDLNQYSYVILTLNDYSPRDTFTTTMYVKGQLCPTTVYNYGTEEKKDYISGWQSPDCGTYYQEYTRNMVYIRAEDIKNHAVYYLSGYDESKPNSIKVNTSVFNITYITSENENNPSVSIEGNNYQTLPYSSLTDTAILTEKNGTSNTWTCAKYDTDCFLDYSGVNIDALFNNPLETLKSIWGTITSIFEIVTDFISLLPPVMQAFLYLAFGVGIALGIIKLIL